MTDLIEAYNTARVLLANRKGVTALEYGMIAALIAAAIVGAVTALGSKISATFTAVTAAM